MPSIPFHTHTFEIPTATTAEIEAGVVDDKAITPDQLKPVLNDLVIGAGSVVKVGTPDNNQVGVWTGDGTIEGDPELLFDTASNTLITGAVAGTGGLAIGADFILSGNVGVVTLANIDALDATTEETIRGAIGARETLSASRTYFVRTDGSDSNTGLVDSSGGAWLTIQHAVDHIAENIDAGGQSILIQVRTGTYEEDVLLRPIIGVQNGGMPEIRGDLVTPANVIVNGAGVLSATFFGIGYGNDWLIRGVRITNTNGGHGINAHAAAWVRFGTLDFGDCDSRHILADHLGIAEGQFDYTVSGDALSHAYADAKGHVLVIGNVTLSGTRAFTQFAVADRQGTQFWLGTVTGTATGTRFLVAPNGGGASIYVTGGSLTAFPGNVAGTISAGGIYTTTMTLSGNVAFPAVQVPSSNVNTLDDYEEGTFTTTITFGGAAVGVTYGTQNGIYTKIGNVVHFVARVTLTNKGSSVGTALLNGLPFTCNFLRTPLATRFTAMTSGVGDTMLSSAVTGSATTVDLWKMAAGSIVALTDADFTNSSDIMVSGHYNV